MMDSPESYASQFAQAPYTELIAARDELIQEMREYERESLDPTPKPLQFETRPSPADIYSSSFLYLIELSKLMASRAYEITGEDWEEDEDEDIEEDE